MQINYYLNNVLVRPPKNWKELEIELNFDKDNPTSEVNITDFEWVRDNADLLNSHATSGLTGGVGIFEGVPFRIEMSKAGVTEVVFDGYIDLTDNADFSCMTVKAKAVEKQKIDWLNDVADSFSFEYLASIGSITSADYISMPYVISTVPNYRDTAIAALGVFVVIKELEQAIERLGEFVIGFFNPLEASGYIRAGLYVVYIAVLLTSLVKLINDLFMLIIQPIKYHSCMTINSLLSKGCAHLGLTYAGGDLEDSPYNNACIMPQVLNNYKDDSNRIFGRITPDLSQQPGYFKGTFGDLLRACKTLINGKIIIDGSQLYIVRRDKELRQSGYVLPDLEIDFHKKNTDELKSNYLIEFQTDINERNTIQQYTGTSYQIITKPSFTINSEFVLMKNFERVTIPFALAKRKEELTFPEEVIKALLDVFGALVNGAITVINAIIDVFNDVIELVNDVFGALDTLGIIDEAPEINPIRHIQPVDLGQLIEDRIGMMLLENDFFSVPKIFNISQGQTSRTNKISSTNATDFSAKKAWQNWHYINGFQPDVDRPNGNQYYIYNYDKIPFCFSHYRAIKNNNQCLNFSGENADIMSLKFNIFEQTAQANVRVNKIYTNNIIQTYIEPNGS